MRIRILVVVVVILLTGIALSQIKPGTCSDIANVRAFGAKGDGLTDDTIAIQDAIKCANGVVPVKFQPGVYVVQPVFVLPDNTTLIGGPGAIIRVKAAYGPYSQVFLCTGSCADVTLRDLTVDHNSAANPVANVAELRPHNRSTLAWSGAKAGDVIIENLRVINSVAARDINVLYGRGNTRANLVTVDHCRFEKMGGGAIDWDSSVIFAEAGHLAITNNLVESANGSYNLSQTFSGIEVYGTDAIITGNIVYGYRTGILYGGWNAVIAGNAITTTGGGILLNSQRSISSGATYSLYNITISGNSIRIANASRAYNQQVRLMGIGAYTLSNTAVRNIKIAGNQVSFDVFPNDNYFRWIDANSAGIGFYTSALAVPWDNVTIEANTIDSSPYSGIISNVAISTWRIANNLLRNCGSFPSEKMAEYRYPIRIASPAIEVLSVDHNQIVDTFSVSRTKIAVQVNIVGATNNAKYVEFVDNSVILTGATQTYFKQKYSYNSYVTPHITDHPGLEDDR